jgi:hypothetical protein
MYSWLFCFCFYFVEAQVNGVPSALDNQNKVLSGLSKVVESLVNRMESQDQYEDEEFDEEFEEDIETNDIPSFNPLEEILDAGSSGAEGFFDTEGVQVLQEILNETEQKPDYGPPINPRVADSFNKIPRQEVNKEALDKLKDQLKIPENGKSLGAPRLNSELWRYLPPQVRTVDSKFQYLQQQISRALVGQARATEMILQLAGSNKLNKEEVAGVSSLLVGSATSLGIAMREINTRRRNYLKSAYPAVAPLCHPSIPVTEFLFGDKFEIDLKAGKINYYYYYYSCLA